MNQLEQIIKNQKEALQEDLRAIIEPAVENGVEDTLDKVCQAVVDRMNILQKALNTGVADDSHLYNKVVDPEINAMLQPDKANDPCIVVEVEGGVVQNVYNKGGFLYDILDWDVDEKINISPEGLAILDQSTRDKIEEHNKNAEND